MADHAWLLKAEQSLKDAGGTFLGFSAKGHRKWRIGKQQIILPDPTKHATTTRHAKANCEALVARAIKKYGRWPVLVPDNGQPEPVVLQPPPPDFPTVAVPTGKRPYRLHKTSYPCLREGCPSPGPFAKPVMLSLHTRKMHPKPKEVIRRHKPEAYQPEDFAVLVLQRVEALTKRVEALEEPMMLAAQITQLQARLAKLAEGHRA